MKGREKRGERLAIPAFKMAAPVMSDFQGFKRPVHKAYRAKKILCPDENCYQKMLFFDQNGIGQHFRAIHKTEAHSNVLARAALKMQELHGQETSPYIAYISEYKSKASHTLFIY